MKYTDLYKQAKTKNQEALDLLSTDAPDMDRVNALRGEASALQNRADAMKAISAELADMNTADPVADLPAEDKNPAKAAATEPNDVEGEMAKAAYVIQYGDIDANIGRIMGEVYGTQNFRQSAYEQQKGFSAWMRSGVPNGNVSKRQLWPERAVKSMIQQGMSVSEIKATQMESADVLGGYAVPAMVTDRILARQAGLSAVRASGATVMNLTTNSVEMLALTGGNSRYTTGLRGSWGNETSSPSAKNFTFGVEQLATHVYTYKTPFSVSLLEDATNVIDIFTRLVAETMALDEDEAFLTGSGVGRPHGILPGGSNTRSLTEQVSLSASALTIGGLKLLRRTVASQYRGQASAMIGNSSTGGAIETLEDQNGNFYFEGLESGQRVAKLNLTWRESEAMPSVAAGTYPLIFGDFSGYYIAERLGMAVQRYNDSNTGINVVEFHIRRRVGGTLLEPWKFGVQKVAAS